MTQTRSTLDAQPQEKASFDCDGYIRGVSYPEEYPQVEVHVQPTLSRILPLLSLILTLSAASLASAQISDEDRRRAAAAYDQGVQAFNEDDFQTAARAFETAYRYAPAGIALIQAMNMHLELNNDQRAANLALRLVELHGEEGLDLEHAEEVIREAEKKFHRVNTKCDAECTITAAGAIQFHSSFFLRPGRSLAVIAEFPGGRKTERITPEAGTSSDLEFIAPPAPEPQVATTAAGETVQVGTAAADSDEKRGLHRAVFFTTLGVAVAAGAGAIYPGIATNQKKNDYDAAVEAGDRAAADELASDGKRLQRVTNGLAFSAAGVGVVALVTAIFTDWSGGKSDEAASKKPKFNAAVGRDMMSLTVEGRF